MTNAKLSSVFDFLLICCVYQIPDVQAENELIDAVVVDEESVGLVDAPGCGAKILRGGGALEQYLTKMEESVV